MKKKIYAVVIILLIIASLLIGTLINNNSKDQKKEEEVKEDIPHKKDEWINSKLIPVYEFYGNGCPHCERLNLWYDELSKEEKDKFNLIQYEIWYSDTNNELLTRVAKHFNIPEDEIYIPFIVIGDNYIDGFDEIETPKKIFSMIDELSKKDNPFNINSIIDMTKGNYEYYK